MIKIKHGNHGFYSFGSQQFHHAAYAYVHAPAVIPPYISICISGKDNNPATGLLSKPNKQKYNI
jgi:hypothetical protein